MRHVLSTAAGLVALLGATACEHYAPAPPSLAVVDAEVGSVVAAREIVVLAKTRVLADTVIARSWTEGYRLLRRESLEGLGLHLVVLETPLGVPPAVAIRRLEALAPGVTAGVNHAFSAETRADHMPRARVYADAMLGWPAGGCPAATARVGIIDGAIDEQEPGLSGTEIIARQFTPDKASAHHGTVVALVLAGPGRLSGASIYNAVVVGDDTDRQRTASVETLVRAIDWLQQNNVRLVNVSMEGPYNKILERSIQRAVDLGMIIVASAGNAGPASAPRYPAAFADVIAVTAVDAGGAVYEEAVRGEHIAVAAPGVEVFVPVAPRGRYVSGTSIAAAHVTAVLATQGEALRGSAREARAHLTATTIDIGQNGPDATFGFGLARLASACKQQ